MRLGQGRGRHRRMEFGEQAARRPAQRLGDLRVGLLHGEGLELILQPGEVVGEHLAEDVGAGRQQLAELDRHRPQPLQGKGQSLARPAAARLRPPEQPQDLRQQPRAGRQVGIEPLRQQGVGAHQHPQRSEQTEEGGDVAHDETAPIGPRPPNRGAEPPRRR